MQQNPVYLQLVGQMYVIDMFWKNFVVEKK